MRVLKNTKSHPTADWIYQKARQEIPHISLGTVYRNLRNLSQEGKIKRLTLNSSSDRYDADISFHYNFACQKCGKIYDVKPQGEKRLLKEVEKNTGFKVEGIKIDLFGLCRGCKN